jgi:hypothetical protein
MVTLMMKWMTPIASLVVLVGMNLSHVPIAQARKILVPGSSFCQVAISSTVKKLESVPNTKSVRFLTNPLNGYANVPTGKTDRYTFVVSGRGGETILRSPKTMQTLASQVLNNCNAPGIVSFDLYQTDAFAVYGMVNGRLQAFTCYKSTRSLPQKMPWGQRVCL